MWTPILISIALASSLQILLWMYSVKIRNAGWVDFGWSAGMWMSSFVILFSSGFSPRVWLAFGVLNFWSARLAWHIYYDRLRHRPEEDRRYQNLRRHWGASANRKFFWVFWGQALLVALFMTPALVVSKHGGGFPSLWDVLGLGIALLSIAGESLADHQLAGFRKDPSTQGQVCKRGLWHYSRHPNYFFEWLHWWGYVVMAVGSSRWYLCLLGPCFMYIFLRYVTGVPHAERQSLQSRGDAYREYQQSTPVFFPWTPHKS
ncbi:DUF1295 domain-containing protein [Kiritimatiellaeota bacterium B1221]|nr:DUF1295 domain-containing protein [Kiritimatiellaeota bacterium B1221]